MTVAMTEADVDIHTCTVTGILTSTVSTSFEKRFTIRPIGVVSKNDIGARSIR